MKSIRLVATTAAIAVLTTASQAAPATYVKGHNASASQLLIANGGAGEFLIVNQAATGNEDLNADGGNPTWGWEVPRGAATSTGTWNIGDKVAFTGFAMPFWASSPNTDGSSNTQDATHRIRIYSCGPNNEWDGVGTDSQIGQVDVLFRSAGSGVDVFQVNFDAPVVWDHADSTKFYFYIQALGAANAGDVGTAMRIKAGAPNAVAQRENRTNGAEFGVPTTQRLSFAATIVEKTWYGDNDDTDTFGIADWDDSSLFWDGGTEPYVDGDGAIFDESFDGTSSTVNLTTALTPGNVIVDNTSGGTVPTYTFSGTGKLSGGMTLSKSSDGTLVLANTGGNDFTGDTKIVQGSLRSDVDAALSPNSVVVIGGSGNSVLDLNGTSQTIAGLRTAGANTRQVRNGSVTDATLTINNTANYNYGSQLGGTDANDRNFSLIKTGDGIQTISTPAANYSGTTLVSGGVLNVTGNLTETSAVTVENVGSLQVQGSITNGVIVETGATFSAGNAGTGDGSVGSLTLNAGSTFAVEIDSSVTTDVSQVETATAEGTATADGDMLVTVTGDGITGSPLTLIVSILNGDTPEDWASKVRAALIGDVGITALYTVGGTGADITLTRTSVAANDPTLNIALANDVGSPGITEAPISADTAIGGAFVTPTAEQIVATGSVSIDPAAILTVADLASTPAVLPDGTVLTLIDYSAGTLTGTFNGLAEDAIVTLGDNDFTLSYGSGSNDSVTLTVSAAPTDPYADWAATNITAIDAGALAGFGDDADNDGLDNGLEWILGGDPLDGNLSNGLPTATGDATNGLTMIFNREPDSITGTTLSVEWDTDLNGTFANSILIGTADVGTDGDNPTVDIDAPAAGMVTINIPAANAGASGRLFARLVASPN